jgi:hypothetical protein
MMTLDGATEGELAVMQSQLEAAQASDPDLFKPEADAEEQAAATLDEPTGEQLTKVGDEPAGDDDAGTGADTEKKSEAGSQKPEADQPEAKAKVDPKADDKAKELEDKRSKFVKNQERLERTWKGVNERKAELDKQEAELKARAESFAKQQAELEAKLAESQKPSHTPEQYESAAAHWEKQGQLDLAESARAEAKRLRENPPKPMTPTAHAQQLQEAQKQSWVKAKEQFPELVDPKHPLNADMKKWLAEHGQTHPVMQLPEGPRLIAQFLKVHRDYREMKEVSARVPVLEQQVAELTAKRTELERLLSTTGGGPTPQPKARAFEDMSDEEQEDYLRNAARNAR